MKFTQENAPEFEQKDDKLDRLKHIERQFGWRGEDWHFRLLEKLTPNQVHGFFGHAKLKDHTLWFDGSNSTGKIGFEWARDRLRSELASIFGNIRVCLASGGKILSEFQAFYGDKTKNAGNHGYITASEMRLMMDLSKRAMAGEKVDSVAELDRARNG